MNSSNATTELPSLTVKCPIGNQRSPCRGTGLEQTIKSFQETSFIHCQCPMLRPTFPVDANHCGSQQWTSPPLTARSNPASLSKSFQSKLQSAARGAYGSHRGHGPVQSMPSIRWRHVGICFSCPCSLEKCVCPCKPCQDRHCIRYRDGSLGATRGADREADGTNKC